jgi:hypothetical protein
VQHFLIGSHLWGLDAFYFFVAILELQIILEIINRWEKVLGISCLAMAL